MIQATFYICTYVDGRQYPVLNVSPHSYNMLYELGMYSLSKSENVRVAITEIEHVLYGLTEMYLLSAGDWCVVEVRRSTSTIRNNFDEFEPIEISTAQIIGLMKNWLEFLLIYERGQIPGYTSPRRLNLDNSLITMFVM